MVVYRNKQKQYDLLTRAINFAKTFLYILLIFVAKFNLKMMQFDIINIFIYANLNKTVFIHLLFEYDKNSKILYLNKVFYNL